jgi:D-2-hydroxyacid dehydrogenase (NADP+)
MTEILAYLKEPEASAFRFERLASLTPGIRVHLASEPADIDAGAAHANVLVTIGPHLGGDAAEVYRRLPRLQWVQSIGTGVDNIKDHPMLGPQVAVTNVRGLHGPQMSEAAVAAMLLFARDVRSQLAHQDSREWRKMPVSLLFGKTVAVLGIGAIARDLADRCNAFGMRVIGISSAPRSEEGFSRIFDRASMGEALAQADFLVVLTPYSAQTHHLLDARAFAQMKAGSYLINIARGGIVDERALLVALDSSGLAGAAMDVFETEPLPASSPFWSHPKVIVTPHSSGFHAGYADQAYQFIARNLTNFLVGGSAALENRV